MPKLSVPKPLPRVARFEKLAYGLFLHWGLYSLVGKGEWFLEHHQAPKKPYNAMIEQFTAADFDARKIARWARQCGMRYAVLTSRHHDGFSLYDTRGLNNFDAPHSAAGRDLLAEFIEGCRAENIVPFLYHTTLDWQWDTARCSEAKFNEYLDYLQASVEVVCRNYGPLGGLWFDGNWSRRQSDWKEDRLYGMIRRLQPEAMIINNSSLSALGAVGHPELDVTTYEQGRPKAMKRAGMKKYLAAEMCQTMNHHWGIAVHDFALKSPRDVILDLCACRRVGANLLMNVGPTATGAIPAYEEAALRSAGAWIQLHEEALYDIQPVDCTTVGRDFVLRSRGRGRNQPERLFLFVHDLVIENNSHEGLKAGGRIGLRTVQGLGVKIKGARWLDNGQKLSVVGDADNAAIDCTAYPYGTDLVVRVAELQV